MLQETRPPMNVIREGCAARTSQHCDLSLCAYAGAFVSLCDFVLSACVCVCCLPACACVCLLVPLLVSYACECVVCLGVLVC